jgi:5'-deoxynucleotidase YfbR-like HD superfamily hydrolase
MPSSDLNHVHTVSKKAVYIKDPDPKLIDIEDIAHALSLHCRYGGQIPKHYSVAQHSVLVSQLCDPKDAFWGLMHDAAEAYTGDIISPIKVLLRDYKKIEAYFMNVICDKFGLHRKMPPSVKVADYNAYLLEEDNLRGNNYWPSGIIPGWTATIKPLRFWTPEAAEKAFLRRFRELTK